MQTEKTIDRRAARADILTDAKSSWERARRHMHYAGIDLSAFENVPMLQKTGNT
jgi:hypothetical protein